MKIKNIALAALAVFVVKSITSSTGVQMRPIIGPVAPTIVMPGQRTGPVIPMGPLTAGGRHLVSIYCSRPGTIASAPNMASPGFVEALTLKSGAKCYAFKPTEQEVSQYVKEDLNKNIENLETAIGQEVEGEPGLSESATMSSMTASRAQQPHLLGTEGHGRRLIANMR